MDDVTVLDTIVVTPGSNADIFRSDYGIDSLAQAQQAIDNADRLFAADGHLWDNDRAFFDETAREVKQRFEDGTYKEGELAESEPMEDGRDLWGNARHAANDSHEWKAICSVPDFCKVGNAVVPFDSFATLGNQTQSSPDVKAQGVPVYRVGDLHKGVQGDAGSHVVAGTSLGGGYVRFLSGQNDVKVNGIPLVRQDSTCLVNCNGAGIGGAPGKVVTTQRSADTRAEKPAQEANPELQALLDAEADERSLWQKTKDFGSSAWSSTQRIAGASADDPLDTGVGVLKGIGNLPTDLWNLGVMASKYSSAAGIPPIALRAHAMEKAALAAHQAGDLTKANELASQASQMMNAGYAGDLFELTSDAQTGGSVLSMFIPGSVVVKGASRAGKAARVMDTAADTARGADVAADAGGLGRRLPEATKEAEKAADAAGTGVHIAKLSNAQQYARLVNSNKRWSWEKDFPGGENLTRGQKEAIKRQAIAEGLIPDVPFKPGTKFPDFEKAGLVSRVEHLPEHLWKSGDKAQFKWLDSQIPGGRPSGFTWHHSELPGRMELVPFGPHNIITHSGGRSTGMWAAGKR
ncbi:HNH endonuclease [Phytopseudomonas dryadis]|uniref:Uncharacterized protein n=1 Tax=Phytopseudomonas dryadis TaxID=2487520 RepID=A0A4Q9R8N1_9GAMM|nr:HNH endonuclease [Pseudomonas dryadis]TBU96081.1 hypothetical protein DNK44_04815 [Pseudomonas dryadis]